LVNHLGSTITSIFIDPYPKKLQHHLYIGF